MLHTKFGQDWPSNSWEEDVNGRCIAIGHLSDSGDPKLNKPNSAKLILHRIYLFQGHGK